MQANKNYVALFIGFHRMVRDKATSAEQSIDKLYINAPRQL